MIKKYIILISVLILPYFNVKSEEVYLPIELRINRSSIIVLAKFKGFKWGKKIYKGEPPPKKNVFEPDKINAQKVTLFFELIECLKGKIGKDVIVKTYTHTYDFVWRSTGFSPRSLKKNQTYICFLIKKYDSIELPSNSSQYIKKLTALTIHRRMDSGNQIIEKQLSKDQYISYIKEYIKNKKSNTN
jgi:hypothetical protein